jgi:hypothetical protein
LRDVLGNAVRERPRERARRHERIDLRERHCERAYAVSLSSGADGDRVRSPCRTRGRARADSRRA